MAILNVNLTSICAGGGHIVVSANVNGGAARTIYADVESIMSAISDSDAQRFMEILLKMHAIGKTKLQVRDNLQAGLVITI